jgi:hypothetical protein
MGVEYIVIAHGVKNASRKHQCPLPGAYRRWRDNIYENSVIRCQECGKYWKWCYIPYPSGKGGFMSWEIWNTV